MKKRLLTYLVAIVFLLIGVSAYGADADTSQVTMSGAMFIEISGATGDVSVTSPDPLGNSQAGIPVDWIIFDPGATGDSISLKWVDANGVDIFPDNITASASDRTIVYYGGDYIPFFLDYSGCTLSTGAKVLIKLKGPG